MPAPLEPPVSVSRSYVPAECLIEEKCQWRVCRKGGKANEPCESYEYGTCAAIVIVGFLQLSNDVLADGVIIPGSTHFGGLCSFWGIDRWVNTQQSLQIKREIQEKERQNTMGIESQKEKNVQ
jgi:hypothetical protein